VDGKYVKVKGYKDKIPFIYGIDYLTHDIVVSCLALAEDGFWFDKFFAALRQANYPLKIAVSDERAGLKKACLWHYPLCLFQLCVFHYLRNLREKLSIGKSEKYQHFFNSLNLHVFEEPKTRQEAIQGLMHVRNNRCNNDQMLIDIVMDIHLRQDLFFSHLEVAGCPNNTNLIELYNSHLNDRVTSTKGFNSFGSADRWLNAHVLRRRTNKFTDCEEKFKHLNGHCSLEFTVRDNSALEKILRILYS
jgi:transposase-like protein